MSWCLKVLSQIFSSDAKKFVHFSRRKLLPIRDESLFITFLRFVFTIKYVTDKSNSTLKNKNNNIHHDYNPENFFRLWTLIVSRLRFTERYSESRIKSQLLILLVRDGYKFFGFRLNLASINTK